MSDEKIDVLAVMDRQIASATSLAEAYSDAPANRMALVHLSASRSAVAELIEAGTAYDAAMRSEADTDGMLRRESARARLRAALARVCSS